MTFVHQASLAGVACHLVLPKSIGKSRKSIGKSRKSIGTSMQSIGKSMKAIGNP